VSVRLQVVPPDLIRSTYHFVLVDEVILGIVLGSLLGMWK
jgi:hypothetical protein